MLSVQGTNSRDSAELKAALAYRNMTEQSSDEQPSLDDLISLSEAAKISGLSHSHLRLLARNGHIWAKWLGRGWFTTEQAVNEYLSQEHKPGPKPKKDE